MKTYKVELSRCVYERATVTVECGDGEEAIRLARGMADELEWESTADYGPNEVEDVEEITP